MAEPPILAVAEADPRILRVLQRRAKFNELNRLRNISKVAVLGQLVTGLTAFWSRSGSSSQVSR